MAKWSWSKLQTARQCQLALHLEHVQKVPKNIPEFLHAGRANHSVLEEASRRCFLNGAPEPIEIIAEEMRVEHENGSWPRADVKIFDRLPDLIGSAPIPQLGETLLLEKKFLVDEIGMLELEGTKSKDAFCAGLGDHIVFGPNRLVVWDWKTGWGSGSFDNIDQVILYAGMAMAWLQDQGQPWPPHIEVAIKHSFVPRVDQEATFTGEQIQHRYGVLLGEMGSLNHILDNETPPEGKFGDHCSNCFVAAHCPLYKEKVKNPSVWDGPGEAWAMREVLKKELKNLEDFLKKEIAVHTRVDVGTEHPLRYQTSQTPGIDLGKAWPLLREMGVTTPMFLHHATLSKTAMFKLIKDKGQRAQLMLEASYVKSTTNKMTNKPEPQEEIE